MLVGLAVVPAASLVATAAPGAGGADVQHVTIIGDSVAQGIEGDNPALAIVGAALSVDLELAACRRVDGDSCPIDGVAPSNVVQLVKQMGSKLGPTVVVAVGYNDFEDQYAANIETALAALKRAGVQKVYWLTLRAVRHSYLSMNDDIEAAASRHPELEVIDWNAYSRTHPDWFQDDGLHLLPAGSEGMATLIHDTLVADGIAPRPVQVATSQLPVGRRGKAYRATLEPSDGLGPFQWSLSARAPKGIHLEANGRIYGKPLVKGVYTLNVEVKDAAGEMSSRELTLTVKR